MKTKNGVYNIAFSIFGQLVTIIFGLLIPRYLTLGYGSETNALFNTINTIFSYFTLLEAGIGISTVQALYKPVALDDKKSINGVLSATSKYYKKVALVYLLCLLGFALSFFFFSAETQKSFDYYQVFLIVLFSGLGSVVNFLVQEKFKLLLDAEGKKYITVNTQTIIFMLTSVSKITCIQLGLNIIFIQISFFVINLIQVVFIYWYIKKNYKWVDLKVEPNYQAISQKNSVLVHQIASLVFSNTDILILWIFQGPQVVSIYTMYKLPVSMIATLLYNVTNSCNFILGQTFSKNKERYIKLIDAFDSFIQPLGFVLLTVTYVLLIPFMKLYSSGFDINYIDYKLPLLYIIIELLIVIRTASLNTILIAGHFKKTQYRALIEAGINLFASLICVKIFGIYGVLFGTILAFLYRDNDIMIYANKCILKRKPTKTYYIAFINIAVFGLIVLLNNFIIIPADNYFQLLLSAFVLTIILAVIYYAVNIFANQKEYKYILGFIKGKIKSKNKLNSLKK